MARLGLSKQNLISRGAARFKDLVYLALQDKKLQRNGTVHTRLGSLDEGEIANVKDLAWHAVGMCVAKLPSEKLVVVAGDGTVFTYVGGQQGSEKIAGAFDLRGCATVDGYAYAFGMNRAVFRRGHERRWTAMHAPGVEADNEVAGFEALDGFGADDLYAAGWGGEVWHWRGNAWSRCETRVDIVLSGICCGGDGLVYACGQSGTLLRGRGREWEALHTEGLTDDFLGRALVQGATLRRKHEQLVRAVWRCTDAGRVRSRCARKLLQADRRGRCAVVSRSTEFILVRRCSVEPLGMM